MSEEIKDVYDVAEEVIDGKEKIDEVTGALDTAIDVTAQSDALNTAINDYYAATEAGDNEAIADAQVDIMRTLFEYGDYIPDTCGGYFWDIYKDVFEKGVAIAEKDAEYERIRGLQIEAAPYAASNPEAYNYYATILENFDEYYAKKQALDKALENSEPQTAIAMFYESYEEHKDPFKNIRELLEPFGDEVTDWVIKTFPGIDKKVNDIFEYFDDAPSILDFFAKKEKVAVSSEYAGRKIDFSKIERIRDRLLSANNATYDPFILDLGGDGFNIETKENGTNFDLDNNGFAEKINWTKKDGFLCLDLNNNGIIDNGGELFGDNTLLADGTKAKNGFEALAQYDSNGDGVIDENDEIFGSLKVWVDEDGDGISASGEMKTLAELGIKSINLNYTNVNGDTGTEAIIGNAATFTYIDGTTNQAGELWVSVDAFDTVDKTDIEIPDDIKGLPNVGSIGNVHSLHNAMALDETGELKALVESFVAEQESDKRFEIAEKILLFVTGAKNVPSASRGSYIDARYLTAVEQLLGQGYNGVTGSDPHMDSAPLIKAAYEDLLAMYCCELNAQTHIKDYVELLRYTENEDGTKTLNADLVNYVLEYQLANGDDSVKSVLTDIMRYVKYLDDGGIKGYNSFVFNYAELLREYAGSGQFVSRTYVGDGVKALNGTWKDEFMVGTDGADTINGDYGRDMIFGGKGDDILYGGCDDDTYYFNLGDGNDIINEDNRASKNDRIVFGDGISAEDIRVERSGNDLIIRYSDTDSITLKHQHYSTYYWIENFEFADGTVVSINDYLNRTVTVTGSGEIKDYEVGYGTKDAILIGSDGADTISGFFGNDTLIGGKGDDVLYGGYDNDTYVFNIGDGNDIINEQNTGSTGDKIAFGEGISAEDIIFSNSGYNLLISIAGTDDSITVNSHNYSWNYRVESFVTADGYSIDCSRINQLVQAMASFEADTGMSWTEAVEQGNETALGIVSEMWVKSVS